MYIIIGPKMLGTVCSVYKIENLFFCFNFTHFQLKLIKCSPVKSSVLTVVIVQRFVCIDLRLAFWLSRGHLASLI